MSANDVRFNIATGRHYDPRKDEQKSYNPKDHPYPKWITVGTGEHQKRLIVNNLSEEQLLLGIKEAAAKVVSVDVANLVQQPVETPKRGRPKKVAETPLPQNLD